MRPEVSAILAVLRRAAAEGRSAGLTPSDVEALDGAVAERAELLEALDQVAHERDFVVRCNEHIQEAVRAAIAKARGGA